MKSPFSVSRPPAARRGRPRLRSALVRGRPALRRLAGRNSGIDVRSEGGFLLIEVMMSAMFVAVIVVATLNGFDIANKTTAEQRRQDEANVLVAQYQEQLRSNPATTLVALETTAHSFTSEVNGTKFTIRQSAQPVGSSGSSTGCNTNETTSQSAANFQVTTSVTWAQQEKLKRPAIKASSIITPPTGSGLEIDVTTGKEPVSGVTALAKFEPVGGGTATSAEGTTGSNGCVVFTGIPATKATVEIPQQTGYVTQAGTLKYPPSEITIAPNYTVHDPVVYAQGGRVIARYTYKGVEPPAEYEREPGKKEKITGDTFVVYNTNGEFGEPHFQVGSSAFEYESGGEGRYKSAPSGYASEVETAKGTKYPTGDLFPFPSAEWEAYAGDCPKNNPSTITAALPEKVKALKGLVSPGLSQVIKIPLSYVHLNVYSGTQKSKGSLESIEYPVTITNTECSGYATPNNAFGANIVHPNKTSTEGHLKFPFQPFGNASLCVLAERGGVKRAFTVSYDNTTTAGSTKSIFLGENSEAEKLAVRESEKSAFATRRPMKKPRSRNGRAKKPR